MRQAKFVMEKLFHIAKSERMLNLYRMDENGSCASNRPRWPGGTAGTRLRSVFMTTATMKPMTTGMMMPGVGSPMPTAAPAMTGMMIPRCTMKMEKCTGGMKITCVCDDKIACTMLQNLCSMMAGSMCSCCCMMNGTMVCCAT